MEPWSFHFGSCALRVWPFYLWSFQIFNTMEQRPTDFMLWMGDHMYMLKPWQWSSADSMRQAYDAQRAISPLKEYMNSRTQYAIWDDHDYGPNNSGAEFENKLISKQVFEEKWPQQKAAGAEGTYTTFIHKEAQFFLLDGRYFKVQDSQLLGATQLEWLCTELKKSTAPFKFIVLGIQAISDGPFENFSDYNKEYTQFMNFIDTARIEGIVFLSGDVHFSEVSTLTRPNAYPLYDFTMSPLTSFPINYFSTNNFRVKDTKKNKNNFGEVSFSGAPDQRVCAIKCISRKNKILWEFAIPEEALKYKN